MTTKTKTETIPFSRELAKEMQRDLSDMMYTLVEPYRGRDHYLCPFCRRYAYLEIINGRYHSNDIEHSPDCLGMRMMKELDKRLNEERCSCPGEHWDCQGTGLAHPEGKTVEVPWTRQPAMPKEGANG